jgi:16S rRNA (cytidine1402-2'-O)-methyltransferase
VPAERKPSRGSSEGKSDAILAKKRAGRLYLVATPIGNLGDITRRAVEILGAVDMILAEDTRHTRKLLSHLGIKVPTSAYHAHNEARATPGALAALENGDQLALVSDAGTPAVSDPGSRLVRAAITAGIEVVPVPGASAVLAALVASGLPTERFTFLGYPPRKAGELARFLGDVADSSATLILLESPRRVGTTLRAAAKELGAARQACVARELTKTHEEFMRGTLSDLAEAIDAPLRGEVTLVIEGAPPGDVVQLDAATLRDRYAVLLAEGIAPKAALKRLVEVTGMRRRDVYRAIHSANDPDATATPGATP